MKSLKGLVAIVLIIVGLSMYLVSFKRLLAHDWMFCIAFLLWGRTLLEFGNSLGSSMIEEDYKKDLIEALKQKKESNGTGN
jgi:hypothetical protein